MSSKCFNVLAALAFLALTACSSNGDIPEKVYQAPSANASYDGSAQVAQPPAPAYPAPPSTGEILSGIDPVEEADKIANECSPSRSGQVCGSTRDINFLDEIYEYSHYGRPLQERTYGVSGGGACVCYDPGYEDSRRSLGRRNHDFRSRSSRRYR